MGTPVVDNSSYLERARTRGVNPLVYWIVRSILQPFFHLYFRLERHGREHVPATGPCLIAANHRSFLDPFVIGTMTRRPVYFVAKQELFKRRWQAWLLNALGAFPIDRGNADGDAMATARHILERGDCVVIFVEGTRVRPGPLGRPRKGVGRLALETGAPVVPVAVIGTEAIRRGWRIRPHKVRLRAGRPLTFPRVEKPTQRLAGAVTDRIWPCICLQWEWLGGTPPVRRAAVVGAGSWGTSVAVALARAGLHVDLGCRTAEQAAALAETRVNERYLPGVLLPETVTPLACEALDLSRHDLVVLAVPSRALPQAIAAHGAAIPRRAGVLVLAKGLVPGGALPSAYVAERTTARAVAVLGGPGHAQEVLAHGASLITASTDPGFGRQLAQVLRDAGLDAGVSRDITGVEFASCAKNAAALAAAAAAPHGANAAGAAAGKVFAEVAALAQARGADAESFAGLAGAGDLVATVLAAGSRNRRAGDLLGRGLPGSEITPRLGQTAEALDALPVLAEVLRREHIDAPATTALADLVEGRIGADRWVQTLSAPRAA
jgi:1-acyl-sn-glycerol-3-phosphate acyltransferase